MLARFGEIGAKGELGSRIAENRMGVGGREETGRGNG